MHPNFADAARVARTPWRGRSLKIGGEPTVNGRQQRKAFNALSLCERECGKTADELRAEQQQMRAAALARFGVSDDLENVGGSHSLAAPRTPAPSAPTPGAGVRPSSSGTAR